MITSSWFLPSWNCVFLNRWINFILKSPADNSAISICQSRWLITGNSAGLTWRWASGHSFTLKSDSNSSFIGLAEKSSWTKKRIHRPMLHGPCSVVRSQVCSRSRKSLSRKNLYRLKFFGYIRFSLFYLEPRFWVFRYSRTQCDKRSKYVRDCGSHNIWLFLMKHEPWKILKEVQWPKWVPSWSFFSIDRNRTTSLNGWSWINSEKEKSEKSEFWGNFGAIFLSVKNSIVAWKSKLKSGYISQKRKILIFFIKISVRFWVSFWRFKIWYPNFSEIRTFRIFWNQVFDQPISSH